MDNRAYETGGSGSVDHIDRVAYNPYNNMDEIKVHNPPSVINNVKKDNAIYASHDPKARDNNNDNSKGESNGMLKVLVGVLVFIVLGLIVAVVVVAVVFSPVLEENKKNKDLISQLNTTLNLLRNELTTISQNYGNVDKTLENTARELTLLRSSTWKNISNLVSQDKDISQEMDVEKKMHQFVFTGFNYDRNKNGKVEQQCAPGITPNVHKCLLYCYQRSQQESALDGMAYNRVTNDCCCNYNTDPSRPFEDPNFLNYRLTRENKT